MGPSIPRGFWADQPEDLFNFTDFTSWRESVPAFFGNSDGANAAGDIGTAVSALASGMPALGDLDVGTIMSDHGPEAAGIDIPATPATEEFDAGGIVTEHTAKAAEVLDGLDVGGPPDGVDIPATPATEEFDVGAIVTEHTARAAEAPSGHDTGGPPDTFDFTADFTALPAMHDVDVDVAAIVSEHTARAAETVSGHDIGGPPEGIDIPGLGYNGLEWIGHHDFMMG